MYVVNQIYTTSTQMVTMHKKMVISTTMVAWSQYISLAYTFISESVMIRMLARLNRNLVILRFQVRMSFTQ